MKKTLTLLTLLLPFLNYGTVSAKELNVVVSIAPLHSLMSSLMKGAGKPTLLYDENFDQTTALDPFQKSHVITADMTVWVGSGLEASLGHGARRREQEAGQNQARPRRGLRSHRE